MILSRTARLRVFLIFAALALVPSWARAQTGELRGSVSDSSGAVLPGVTVTLRQEATGVVRLVVTDEQGVFRAPALQPGPYAIESELQGFGKDVRKVLLTVGQVADLKITLTVGTVSETVQVVGTSPVEIETTKSDLSAVVSQEQLAELPVLNRGFVGLAQLLPGGGPARTGDGRFGISTAFGGTNVRSMYSMQIDGGVMDHPIYGFAIVNVSQDAVQEFRVLRNQFDAEYSRAGTAVVNVVTRSGTNQLHGQVSYFGRDDGLNAKNAFATTKPPFDSSRVSGSLGGPILRGKAFYFGALEYNRQNSVRIIALPSANPFASQYNGVYANGNRSKLGQAKVDYTASPQHALTARYLYANDDIIEDYELAENTALDFNDLSVSWNWTLGNAMLNNVVVQYLDQDTQRFQLTPDTQVIRPSFTSGRSPNLPQGFPRKRYAVNDTFFWSPGRHAVKFGVRMAYEDLDYLADYYGAGVWQFNTDRAFVQTDPTTWPTKFTVGSGPATRNYRNTEWGFFGQDDVRLGNVTINLGLRYDFDTNLRSNDLIADSGSGSTVRRARQSRPGRSWQRLQQHPAALRLCVGHARRRADGASRRLRSLLGPQPAVVQHPRRRRQQPVHRGGHRPESAALLPRSDAQPSAVARSKTSSAPRAGRALYLPGDDLSLPYVHSTTIGRCEAAAGARRRSKWIYIHQAQKDLQTGTRRQSSARRVRSRPTRVRIRSSHP